MSNFLSYDLRPAPAISGQATVSLSLTERRVAPRVSTRQQGALILQAGAQSLDCAILDVSETGARVTIRQARQVPRDAPLLLSRNGHDVVATVAWQLGFDVGLSFAPSDYAASTSPVMVAA